MSGREVYRSRWMTVREDEVEFPNGTLGTFSVVDKPDFVVVIPWTGDGFWLVQQYRYPVGQREWEFPQGGWPPEHVGGTGTPAELAAAELREETGLRAGSLRNLGRLNASPGYASQRFDVYVATGLTAGDPDREATESDMVHEWHPEQRVRRMVREGELIDAHSIAALALFDADVAADAVVAADADVAARLDPVRTDS